jgi:muconate cycloisomerase
MRIAELVAYHVQIPLKRRIRHASYTRHTSDSIIIRCVLIDGTEGWGEGLPRHYVTGETVETGFDLLRGTPISEQLGAEFQTLDDALALLDPFELTRPEVDPRECYGNAIRCAVELSVLDAACRALGVPVSTITSRYAPAVGVRAESTEVRYGAVITSTSRLKQRVMASLIRMYGFRQTKVKVRAADVDDASSLKRIRRVCGRRMDIRVDANEAWTCQNLEKNLEPLLPFEISCIEQPVPHADVNGLAEVRSRIETPIMLDESLCSLLDARQAIERGTCDLFNIRLSKCGGFLRSLRLAATANQAGLGFQFGCHVGETGILSAAGRHFATSVSGIRYLEGSYDRYLVKERLTHEDLTFGRGGMAPAIVGPGLGISIDEEALRRVTLSEEHYSVS